MPRPASVLQAAEVWFLTGSQHLYGPETLAQVADQSRAIAEQLGAAVPARIVWKPVLTDADAIRRTMLEANADDSRARRDRVDAHLQPGEDVDRRPRRPATSRCCTCTRRRTWRCRGPTSTSTS